MPVTDSEDVDADVLAAARDARGVPDVEEPPRTVKIGAQSWEEF